MQRILSRLTLAMVVGALTWLPRLATAQSPGQETFPSAAKASQALAYAVQGDNQQALASILGPNSDLLGSADDSADQADRQLFLEKYEQMHRLTKERDGDVILFVGAENWPFPVPLMAKGGRWYFDANAGKEEVAMRRIGENELEAIAASLDLVRGGNDHTPGLTSPTPSHGYYYRVLDAQGTVLAYPSEYRSSGVMTFFVTPDGMVYQKDLGSHTESVAAAMQTGSQSRTWQHVDVAD